MSSDNGFSDSQRAPPPERSNSNSADGIRSAIASAKRPKNAQARTASLQLRTVSYPPIVDHGGNSTQVLEGVGGKRHCVQPST